MAHRATALLLLAALAAPLAAGEGPRAGEERPRGKKPGYARFERQPEKLSAEEFARVRGEVLRRCQLAGDTRDRDAPWYFHYELGRALSREGDPQRALDAYIEAALRRQKPQKDARLYGMWFTDYFPYAHIARAHVALGNRECARDALALSEQEGELADEAERRELRALVLGEGSPAPPVR